jgi:transcriptional regulator with XRE-family HTH domain
VRSTKKKLPLLKAFGGLVRSRRERAGLSQEQLAFRVGLHRTYVGSVERGERNITLANIYRLATALGCRVTELMPGESDG